MTKWNDEFFGRDRKRDRNGWKAARRTDRRNRHAQRQFEGWG